MQADLLRQLFSGTLVDPVDIEARAQAAGLPLQATSFAAAVVQIEGYVDPLPTKTLAEVNLAKAWVRERLDCLPTLRVFAQDDDLHTLNLLFLSSLPTGELADPARAFLEALARDLPQELHTSMVWSLGGVVPLVGEIASSHREAREPLLSAGHQGRFWYPLETEIRLLALVKKGDRSGVARALEQIRRENLVDRTLSPTVFSNLASAMYSSMVRGLTQTLESDISHEDAQQWFSWFHQQLLQTCSTISDQKKQGAEGKLVEIDLYLEQNLTDPGLTLFSVAQQFSMTEAFLYHFYRNHAGLSFADSLEKIRIERACRLLVEEQMKISQVIPKTGFTSPSTFRRAFRRVMGVSPSDYHPT